MSNLLPDPPRWKERLDQANLAEREAGRALRFMGTPEPLPTAQLTRIAARIRAGRPRRRTFWLTVTAALLFGGAAVASATHLDVLPGWLIKIVKPQPAETAPHKGASRGPSTRLPATAKAPALPEANALPATIPSTPNQPVPAVATAIPKPAGPINNGSSTGNDFAPLPSRKVVRKSIEEWPAESPPRMPAWAAAPTPSRAPSLEPTPAVTIPSEAQHVRGTQVAWLEKPASPGLASPARVIPDLKPPRPAKRGEVAERSEAGEGLPRFIPEGSGPPPGGATDKDTHAPPEAVQGTAKVLSEAIHALRFEHSPGTALFLLDRHATQLGKSAFAHEALLLRVEAMLALGRKAEVLRMLDGAVLTDVAASRSLLVTRGELRAAANRCADGLGDFDRVLDGANQADRQALYGRALCRKKLGDTAGAQADVERYRREFPSDPRLHDLERQMGGLK